MFSLMPLITDCLLLPNLCPQTFILKCCFIFPGLLLIPALLLSFFISSVTIVFLLKGSQGNAAAPYAFLSRIKSINPMDLLRSLEIFMWSPVRPYPHGISSRINVSVWPDVGVCTDLVILLDLST